MTPNKHGKSHSLSNIVSNHQTLASIIKPELLLLWEVINYIIIFSGIGLPQFQAVNVKNMYQDEKKKKVCNQLHFDLFCAKYGISHNFSAPRTPQQNGVVES